MNLFNKRGYISPVFILIAGIFLTVLVATMVVNARSLDLTPQAATLTKQLQLLPSEQGEIICGNGTKAEVLEVVGSVVKVKCLDSR